jgi:hypothetical protein
MRGGEVGRWNPAGYGLAGGLTPLERLRPYSPSDHSVREERKHHPALLISFRALRNTLRRDRISVDGGINNRQVFLSARFLFRRQTCVG